MTGWWLRNEAAEDIRWSAHWCWSHVLVMSSSATSSLLPSHTGPAMAKVCSVIVRSLAPADWNLNNDEVMQRMQVNLLKQRVSINGMTICVELIPLVAFQF